MSVGSSYSTAKAAIVSKLSARSGLTGVAIRYQAPEKASDVGGESGDAIWLDDAEGNYENPVLPIACGIQENYSLTLVLQSLRPSTGGTQQVADARVDAMLYEFWSEITADHTFGVTAFKHFIVSTASTRRITGVLPTGAGHGARCELRLNVESRIQF